VARLPKTRSGKILRGTIKKIADGDQWTMPATIDDLVILDEIGAAMKTHGVGGSGLVSNYFDAPDLRLKSLLISNALFSRNCAVSAS
jgi:hypothetical protein